MNHRSRIVTAEMELHLEQVPLAVCPNPGCTKAETGPHFCKATPPPNQPCAGEAFIGGTLTADDSGRIAQRQTPFGSALFYSSPPNSGTISPNPANSFRVASWSVWTMPLIPRARATSTNKGRSSM